jgi:hypothetical protein
VSAPAYTPTSVSSWLPVHGIGPVGERRKGLSEPEDLPGVDGLLGSFRWYDALCITQRDNKERSQHVRNMRQIYSRATEVFCWTGASIDPSALKHLIGTAEPDSDEGHLYSAHEREAIDDFFN